MKFLSGWRLRNGRNPSSNDSTAGRRIPQLLLDDEDEDDFRTAATSSDWNFQGGCDDDDDDEISSSGGRYADAAAAPSASTSSSSSSSSSSSMRIRVAAESDANSVPALVNGANSASSAAVAAAAAAVSVPVTGGQRNTDSPPTDDCCPICFGGFVVPCKAPCGHWYCGGCILQYWNYGAALQPCNCPMCSRKITNLTPEASLVLKQEIEVTEVLRNVRKYNRLFVGGLYGSVLRLLETPLYIKRMFQDMMNPDRPGAHLNKLRIIAVKFVWTFENNEL
ncbi:OLC1v1002381C1 [Oldenlandia corymbosa var. corymbosa]|uniref:OLC1v1002381C1 n=1 Tax=Oldenlandia corymbosa var. corymbosa TaxID=529605 RepID=A0AAV1D8P0_OLDCO|nr:OLC1v1002381C1 [Oldenlandia corymbosa var. corymbosa]